MADIVVRPYLILLKVLNSQQKHLQMFCLPKPLLSACG